MGFWIVPEGERGGSRQPIGGLGGVERSMNRDGKDESQCGQPLFRSKYAARCGDRGSFRDADDRQRQSPSKALVQRTKDDDGSLRRTAGCGRGREGRRHCAKGPIMWRLMRKAPKRHPGRTTITHRSRVYDGIRASAITPAADLPLSQPPQTPDVS